MAKTWALGVMRRGGKPCDGDGRAAVQGRADDAKTGETERRWNGDAGDWMRACARSRSGMGVSSAVMRWCRRWKALRRARWGSCEAVDELRAGRDEGRG